MSSKNSLHLAFNPQTFWNSVCWLNPTFLSPNERYCLTVSQKCQSIPCFFVFFTQQTSLMFFTPWQPYLFTSFFFMLGFLTALYITFHCKILWQPVSWKWEFALRGNKGMVHGKLLNSDHQNHTSFVKPQPDLIHRNSFPELQVAQQ